MVCQCDAALRCDDPCPFKNVDCSRGHFKECHRSRILKQYRYCEMYGKTCGDVSNDFCSPERKLLKTCINRGQYPKIKRISNLKLLEDASDKMEG